MDDKFKKLPLTDRMVAILAMVEKCDTVFDIACDHGYIGLGVLKQNLAKRVIFSDIKKGPLLQAKKNFDKYCINKTEMICDFRIGDGLSVIKEQENCDTVIIAGIGYDVMVSILNNIKNYNINTLILSVHSKVEKFKEYLKNMNLKIDDEKIVIDNNKIYYIQKIKLREPLISLL